MKKYVYLFLSFFYLVVTIATIVYILFFTEYTKEKLIFLSFISLMGFLFTYQSICIYSDCIRQEGYTVGFDIGYNEGVYVTKLSTDSQLNAAKAELWDSVIKNVTTD